MLSILHYKLYFWRYEASRMGLSFMRYKNKDLCFVQYPKNIDGVSILTDDIVTQSANGSNPLIFLDNIESTRSFLIAPTSIFYLCIISFNNNNCGSQHLNLHLCISIFILVQFWQITEHQKTSTLWEITMRFHFHVFHE